MCEEGRTFITGIKFWINTDHCNSNCSFVLEKDGTVYGGCSFKALSLLLWWVYWLMPNESSHFWIKERLEINSPISYKVTGSSLSFSYPNYLGGGALNCIQGTINHDLSYKIFKHVDFHSDSIYSQAAKAFHCYVLVQFDFMLSIHLTEKKNM